MNEKLLQEAKKMSGFIFSSQMEKFLSNKVCLV